MPPTNLLTSLYRHLVIMSIFCDHSFHDFYFLVTIKYLTKLNIETGNIVVIFMILYLVFGLHLFGNRFMGLTVD